MSGSNTSWLCRLPVHAVTGILASLMAATAAAGPRMKLDPERLDFGRMKRGEEKRRTLQITNAGDAVLNIKNIRPSCEECVVGDLQVRSLQPGAQVKLPVTYVATDVPGSHTVHMTLRTNDEKSHLRRVYLDVKIQAVQKPRLVVDPEELDLGVVKVDRTVSRDIELHNVGKAPLKIRDFSASPGVNLEKSLPEELAPDEKQRLTCKLRNIQPGIQRAHFALVTNQPDKKVTTVSISGYAATPDEVGRAIEGVVLRRAPDRSGVEVVNHGREMVWVVTEDGTRPVSRGNSLHLEGQGNRQGDRLRVVFELPLSEKILHGKKEK